MSFSQRASDQKYWVLTLQVLPECEEGIGKPGFYLQYVCQRLFFLGDWERITEPQLSGA